MWKGCQCQPTWSEYLHFPAQTLQRTAWEKEKIDQRRTAGGPPLNTVSQAERRRYHAWPLQSRDRNPKEHLC